MPSKAVLACFFLIACLCNRVHSTPNVFPESMGFSALNAPGLFAGLLPGDDRQETLRKLRANRFLGYRELQSDLVKAPVRWDGHSYELTCKFENEGLVLCLIQGEAGWQDFFYDDVVRLQWEGLRKRVVKAYGPSSVSVDFPLLHEVPLNDLGGLVTDRWDLEDRLLMLCVQAYTKEDCCTRQVLDFSCCTLLIQPK